MRNPPPRALSIVGGVEQKIPTNTVARLSRYLAALDGESESSISSEALAEKSGGNAAQVRKDLGYLNAAGVRGVGYDTAGLRNQIRHSLGLGQERRVVIVGAGNLGTALAGYPGFAERGFRVCGVFDKSPRLVGTEIAGHPVLALSDIRECASSPSTMIGVIAVPAGAAQIVADMLVAAGIISILNFAPTPVHVPPGVDVRRVDLSTELHILSHRLLRSEGTG